MPDSVPESNPDLRKIIHVDMDAFFAAVEQRDRPELRGQPLIVGGDPGGWGVVATCSYEARRFGIHPVMSAARTRSLCPQAIPVRPRMEAYREASRQVMAILRSYTPLVEPLSLDAYLIDQIDDDLEFASWMTSANGAVVEKLIVTLVVADNWRDRGILEDFVRKHPGDPRETAGRGADHG